jgi:carbonic anhydrase
MKQSAYETLLINNRKWVETQLQKDPEYFENLAKGQTPHYLFIGCSDSRVHASEITGTIPGEMFVHRNIANLVVHTDINLLSVLQFAVEVLEVHHVIVCGHYGCGGVAAAMDQKAHGLIDNWLRNIKDVYRLHKNELDAITDRDERMKRVVELNVIEQVYNVYKTSIVQKARLHNNIPQVHGWVYNIRDGIIKDLEIDVVKNYTESDHIYRFEDQ